jgi:hypothetical protein
MGEHKINVKVVWQSSMKEATWGEPSAHLRRTNLKGGGCDGTKIYCGRGGWFGEDSKQVKGS